MSCIDTDGPNQDVAISSRIRLARNIEGYSFPGLLSDEDAKKVRERLRSSVFDSSNILKESMDFLNLDELPILQKYMLMEKHLISSELAGREKGSGLILKKDNLLSIMINEEDHLRIQAIFAGLQLDEMWDYIIDNDKEALTTLLVQGKIELMKEGTPVYIRDVNFGCAVIRLKGSTRKLWISNSQIIK